jgi:hypothetical protein
MVKGLVVAGKWVVAGLVAVAQGEVGREVEGMVVVGLGVEGWEVWGWVAAVVRLALGVTRLGVFVAGTWVVPGGLVGG